jgi:hypothetical protein
MRPTSGEVPHLCARCASWASEWYRCPFVALFGHLTPLTNVRFWGESGHDSNGSLCRLMTQSGYFDLENDRPLSCHQLSSG